MTKRGPGKVSRDFYGHVTDVPDFLSHQEFKSNIYCELVHRNVVKLIRKILIKLIFNSETGKNLKFCRTF